MRRFPTDKLAFYVIDYNYEVRLVRTHRAETHVLWIGKGKQKEVSYHFSHLVLGVLYTNASPVGGQKYEALKAAHSFCCLSNVLKNKQPRNDVTMVVTVLS